MAFSRKYLFSGVSLLASAACIYHSSMAGTATQESGGSAAPRTLLGQATGLASAAQNPGQLPTTALNMAADSVKSQWIPTLWGDAPEWLKRTEWDVQFNRINGPQYNILTTQPIWQSEGKKDTFFYQASYEHYNLYDISRNTVNGGIGYRRLMLDNQLLLGVNNFYDYEMNYDHARSSVGVDAKWGVLDAYGNYYFRLNGAKEVKGGTERVNNGYDVGLGAPLPYLPWARVYVKYYDWFGIVGSDSKGGEFSTELALTPNLTFTAGTRGNQPDDSRHNNYAMVQFHFGGDGKPTLLGEPVSTKAFAPRDLTNDTLDKVRRENRILVERTTVSGGRVIIARGN